MNFDKGSVSGHPLRGPILALLCVLLLPCIVSAAEVPPSGNIDPNNDGSAFAWGENIGWINLKPTSGPGVTVTDTAMTGMAWGENVGWINLSPADGGVINDGAGHLSGFAWGENIGWINFAPTGGGGVTITGATGIFTGFAWGENIGWINFASTQGGVTTSWRAPATVQKLIVTPGGNGSGTVTSSPAGIDCGVVCNHYFAGNSSVTLTATVGTDSYFAGWGGACTGTSLTCAVTLSADKAVTATFTHDPVTLWVNRTGGEAGSVASTSPNAAITCGSTCSATLDYGTPVTLTATLSPGGSLVGWTGCDGGSGLTCTVTMNNPRTVTATFAFPLSVIEAGTGSGTVTSNTGGINCTGNSGTCSVLPPTLTSITLTATAASGSTFVGWLGEGCSGTGTCRVVLNEARSVTAIFNLVPLPQSYILAVNKVGNGFGTVASTNPSAAINCGSTCGASFEQLATVTLTATPDPVSGSTFAGWSGPCTGTGSCFVTMTGARTVMATFVAPSGPGAGAAYEVIHHFVGSPSVVAHRLLEGGDGFLYGSGKQGGTNGSGIIFKMRPDGSDFEILAEYPSWNASPHAATDPSELVLASDGVLYGVTEFGGEGAEYSGPGTIFKINRDGTGYAVLHSFNGTTEGSRPLAALIQASNGSLYGSTSAGPNGNSVLFSLVSGTGQFSIIHSFANADGQTVYGALREGIDHKLYGMAAGGGAIGYGTIFRLNLDGSGFEVIHSFDSVVGGGASYGPLVQGAGATLYGATISGGANGAIFKLQPDGSAFTVLHLIDGQREGIYLWSGVVLSGDETLYGAAQQTAYFEKRGTVFALKTDGSRFTTLHTFVDEAEGWWPFSGLLLRSDGSVFGTTSQGGTGTTGDGTASHGGVAFKLSPPFTLNYDLHVSVASAWNGNVISAPGAINCYTECSAYFAPGSTVILTAIPMNGYVFTGWSGDCTGTDICTLTMDGIKNVTATFDTIPPPTGYPVSVTKTGTGSGTVSFSPSGTRCGTNCASFALNSSVTLSAAAATGSVFTGWSDACTGTNPSCTLTVDAAKSVQAGFTSVGTFSIAVVKAGTGNVTSSPAGINCGSTCSASFTFGTSVTLTAAAATGFTFTGWSGQGCSGTGTCTVSATLARTVTAPFHSVYTDDPLVARTTPIKAAHFTELRMAINALWAEYGVPGVFNWSGPAPAIGGVVSATRLADLRTALNQVYDKKGQNHPTYTDPNIAGGQVLIKASHLNELRSYVRGLE